MGLGSPGGQHPLGSSLNCCFQPCSEVVLPAVGSWRIGNAQGQSQALRSPHPRVTL